MLLFGEDLEFNAKRNCGRMHHSGQLSATYYANPMHFSPA
jgi:hypothetical protein